MRRVNEENRKAFNVVRSQNARRTACREEVIKFRSEVLRKWRMDNPEKFMEIMRKGQSSPKRSRAEEWLYNNMLRERGFKRWVLVRCGKILKQVDFVRNKIWIEVDGCWHFGILFHKKSRFDPDKVHSRDVMLCAEAEKRGFTLIRLGTTGCWRGNGKRILREEWQDALKTLIKNRPEGVWLCGESYRSDMWEKDACSTWKFVTTPIILNSLME